MVSLQNDLISFALFREAKFIRVHGSKCNYNGLGSEEVRSTTDTLAGKKL